MSKMFKRTIAAFMSALMLFQLFGFSAFADSEKNYIITDPYEAVDWDEWGAYKFQPHCHTNASDGFLTVAEFVKEHYDLSLIHI